MGGISLAGIGMRTYLFFESVPDRFLDVRSDEWGFEEGSEFVPIILPRNYLNLYNFGFASTRGLPQVSEDLVRVLPSIWIFRDGGSSEISRGVSWLFPTA